MKKIPTVYQRDPNNRKFVTKKVMPGCEWVLDGQGTATRKYDGTCVMHDDKGWWARREVKPGKSFPNGYVPVQTDETTGKTMGWEPVEFSSFYKFFQEAVEDLSEWKHGTYELCGPKIQGNPDRFEKHTLVRHADAEVWWIPNPKGIYPELLVRFLAGFKELGYEGLVWKHPDGRMAKLKVRDFDWSADD